MATWETGSTVTLIASTYMRPITEIYYRAMPYTRGDNSLRPDLAWAKAALLQGYGLRPRAQQHG
jgi:hypothetical protein